MAETPASTPSTPRQRKASAPQRVVRKISAGISALPRPKFSIHGGRQNSLHDSEDEVLTRNEQILVRDTWMKIKDKDAFGAKILKRWFVQSPHTMDYFKVKSVDFSKEPRAVHVASRMMQVIDDCVREINQLEARADSLKILGGKHITYTRTPISADDWKTYVIAMMHCIVEEFSKEKNRIAIKEAWNVLMTFIVRRMQDGYKVARELSNGSMPIVGS